mmetsp:Transcript_1640/g.4898  ORF Transcript_1640/g.4898 Transcript_1640/m.4898 type:complete len:235 (-) Transcript_1640:280-984(-)
MPSLATLDATERVARVGPAGSAMLLGVMPLDTCRSGAVRLGTLRPQLLLEIAASESIVRVSGAVWRDVEEAAERLSSASATATGGAVDPSCCTPGRQHAEMDSLSAMADAGRLSSPLGDDTSDSNMLSYCPAASCGGLASRAAGAGAADGTGAGVSSTTVRRAAATDGSPRCACSPSPPTPCASSSASGDAAINRESTLATALGTCSKRNTQLSPGGSSGSNVCVTRRRRKRCL